MPSYLLSNEARDIMTPKAPRGGDMSIPEWFKKKSQISQYISSFFSFFFFFPCARLDC